MDQRFLKYVVASKSFTDFLVGIQTGTAVPHISGPQIRSYEFGMPELNEQRAIAHVLGSLDDKIELNHRMNSTLEQIAHALFKSWFVDFDPVHAKADGRWKRGKNLEGVTADMWDLWPSESEDSEIGEVPKGWRVDSFYRLAEVKYGAPYASELFNKEKAGFPLIRIRDLPTDEPEAWTTERHPREVLVDSGDVIVGMDGEFRVRHWMGPLSVLNQRLCKLVPREGVPSSFVSLSAAPLFKFFENSKVGTTVVHVGKSDIDTFRVAVPPPEILRAYATATEGALVGRIQLAAISRTLTDLRDTLLPKLLSGEIRAR
jgi:type I restriction enzyme S subunit